MVIGAQFGPKLALRVNSVQLKQVFGLVLVYPLVRMVRAGQMLLDLSGTDFVLATVGNIFVWLLIVVPIGLIKVFLNREKGLVTVQEEPNEVASES